MNDIEDIHPASLSDANPAHLSVPAKRGNRWVISCSRRTDVPAHYLAQYAAAFKRGYITVHPPRSSCSVSYSISPDSVAAIVWWSKDFGKWIEEFIANESFWRQYLHFFQFTINSESELESGIKASLDTRLDQLRWLVSIFGADHIAVRFDPIVHYRLIANPTERRDNLKDFEKIIAASSDAGVKAVRTSLCNTPPKVVSRMKRFGFEIVSPSSVEGARAIITPLVDIAERYGVTLITCSCDQLRAADPRVGTAPCVDGKAINQILARAKPVRKVSVAITPTRTGCRCTSSIDIGEYSLRCPHGCLYCYASPDL